jgi:predicted nucleotidyltransferase
MWLKTLIQALDAKKIRYALVGGYAVALHGAVRGTVDIDLAVAITEKSYIDLESALKSIGLESRLPVSGRDVFRFRDEYIKNRNLIAWSFFDPRNPANVVDVLITEDAASMKRVKMTIGGFSVQVASIDDLIRMKSAAGRPQDLEDVKALRRLKK